MSLLWSKYALDVNFTSECSQDPCFVTFSHLSFYCVRVCVCVCAHTDVCVWEVKLVVTHVIVSPCPCLAIWNKLLQNPAESMQTSVY